MIFNRMKWKNLFSYGDYYTELDLNKDGTTFVRGVIKDTDTSNGSGKSSIIDVLVWTLYGKPLKDIPADKVKCNHTKVGSHAQVEFQVGADLYTINRYRKHKKYGNQIRIFKNGEQVEDGTNRDAQKRLDQILGLDYQSFVSSFTFTSEVTFEFPTLTPDRRRAFLEQILGLKAYSEYGKQAKQQVRELRSALEGIESSLTEKRRFLSREKDDYVTYSDKHKNFDSEKEKFISDLRQKLDSLEQEISNCEPELRKKLDEKQGSLKEALQICKDQIHTQELDLSRLTGEIKDLYSQHKDIATEKSQQEINVDKEKKRVLKEIKKKISLMEHACPTCERDWEDAEVEKLTKQYEDKKSRETKKAEDQLDKIASEYDGKIGEIQIDIDKAEGEISECRNALSEFKDKSAEIEKELLDVFSKLEKLPSEDDLNNLVSQKDKILSEIESKSKETSPYGEVIENLRQKIVDLLDEIDETSVSREKVEVDLRYSAFWDESFNNDGLKMFIFESIIPVMNSRVAYYMPILNEGKDINLQFDKFLNMDIVKDGEEIPYGGLSKGERKRVDLAIALSLLETAQAQHGVSSNVMFFDEIFDSSLDSEGVKTVTEILHTMPFESIFVISHRLEIRSEFDNTVDVVKDGKFSYILTP